MEPEWLPIETAPKEEGSEFIAGNPGRSAKGYPIEFPPRQAKVRVDRDGDLIPLKGEAEPRLGTAYSIDHFTHWKPLSQ